MAPTISVTEEVYEALKRRSGSWEDTPSKIIAKLLKVNDKPREPMRKTNHFPGGIIEKLILFVLGNANPTADQAIAADVNSDGFIDILDIVRIVNIILGN